MQISNIPFAIVFLSSLLPMLGALFNFPVYHIPAALVAGAAVLILIKQQNITVKDNILVTFVVPAMFFILTIQLVTGRGFVTLGVGGYVIIFTLAFFALHSMGTGSSQISIIREISFLYKLFLIGMLIETVLILLGFQPNLVAIFNSTDSPNYKNYNSADILRFFGLFQDAGGLNSPLLGSQVAGMLSLFSTIWFVGIRKIKIQGTVMGHSGLWICVSLLVFLMAVNGMNFLLLVLAGCGYVFFINKKNRVKYAALLMLSIFGIYLAVDNQIIFDRITNQDIVILPPESVENYRQYGILDEVQGLTTLDYYIYQFSTPVVRWLMEDWPNKLLGVGVQFFSDNFYYVGGDFGFGIGMLSSGFLWVFIFSFTVIGICIPALNETKFGSDERQAWSTLGAINALITLLWFASTIHYNVAFANTGGMTLFALHFALTVYCRYRLQLNVIQPSLSHNSRADRAMS